MMNRHALSRTRGEQYGREVDSYFGTSPDIQDERERRDAVPCARIHEGSPCNERQDEHEPFSGPCQKNGCPGFVDPPGEAERIKAYRETRRA